MENNGSNKAITVDIQTRDLLKWDDYREKTPDEGIKAIYDYISAKAKEHTDWYWRSIRSKRKTALWIRMAAFVLLVVGVASQVYSSSQAEASTRLHVTQGSLMLLAIGGLLLLGDRSFGWTSGWTRYISTAMTMESLTRDFQLKWAKYLLTKDKPLTREDALTLFDLAQALQVQLLKAQSEETTAWAAEFHAGLQMLESAIKMQREVTERKLEELRSTVDKENDANRKAQTPGSVEVALKFKADAKRVKIAWDSDTPADFFGTSWTRVSVAPGQHRIEVTLIGDSPLTVSKVIDVQPGTTARVEVPFNA